MEQDLKVLDKEAIKKLKKEGWQFLKLDKIREDSDVCERLGLEYLNGRAPAYGERAWFGINEEEGLLIVVWDTGNGTCSLLEIATKKEGDEKMKKVDGILECLLENGFREERCGKKCPDGSCKHYGICKMFVKLMKKRLTGLGKEIMRLAKIEQVLGGNGCDKCDEIDGDYHKTVFENGHQLKWNRKKKKFVCPRGHVETFDQAMRNETKESLCQRLKKIAMTLEE